MKLVVTGVLALVFLGGLYFKRSYLLSAVDVAVNGPQTVAERVHQYGNGVDSRLAPAFAKAGLTYLPPAVILVVLKEERRVELYAEDARSKFRFVRSYPIMAASGHPGPKLEQGDWQVPEGIYGVESLNPNSHYHLALRVSYPNAFDRAHSEADGRTDLGGDIMIHGSNVSIGCVAMGDPAAEDLFVLAAKVGIKNVKLLFCPFDFRTRKADDMPTEKLPAWTPELYGQLRHELSTLSLPTPSP